MIPTRISHLRGQDIRFAQNSSKSRRRLGLRCPKPGAVYGVGPAGTRLDENLLVGAEQALEVLVRPCEDLALGGFIV